MKLYTYLLTLFFLVLSAQPLLAQTNYDKGYKDGFAKGYCYNQPIGCIPKVPTIAPIPRINERSSSYQNGYDRGYAEALDYRRIENLNQGKTHVNPEIKFNPYISQIPSNGISVLVYKQRLYNERKEWIENVLDKIHSFLTVKFVSLDAGEAGKYYNSMIDFQNKLGDKWPDLSLSNVFDPIKTFLEDNVSSMSNSYIKIKNETDNNVINFDDKYYQNIPKTIKSCFIFFDKNGKAKYEMNERENNEFSGYTTIDKNCQPTFVQNFKVNNKGKDDILYVLYFNKYDSYHFYLKSSLISTSEIGPPKNHEECTAFTFTTEYTQGGYGNPIYIRLSDDRCMLYEKGQALNCNYLGEVHYKINKYHKDIFKETYYAKRHCWEDKASGKKYFLNSKSITDIPICSDNLLVTNNKF